MPKPEVVFARLELRPYADHFDIKEHVHEINERIYEVLKDEFYSRTLTQTLAKLHPEIFAEWSDYQSNRTRTMPEAIRAIGKFTVLDQKVDLVDIRFY